MQRILDWNEYRKTAAEAVAEGCVLLENSNGALPLDKGKPVALFGRIQLDYYKSGTGSGGMVNVSHVIGIPEGLRLRGIEPDGELFEAYSEWTKEHPFDRGEGWGGEPWCQEEMPLTDELVRAAAQRTDTAIVIIGRTAGEEMDYSLAEGSYLLTKGEQDMLAVTRKYFTKQIVLLNVAGIIDMSFVDEYRPDAVMYVWHGGMEGGLGVADALLGNVNPSGRLTDTIAYSIEDYPSHSNFGDQERDFYCEDIYVGYRYFETFAPQKVRYPFGYGLSYTDFEFSDLRLENEPKALENAGDTGKASGNDFCIGVTVTNTGSRPGSEIVQIYCEAPQGLLGKPAKVLCGFAKTKVLEPGGSGRVGISIAPWDIASFDDSGVTGHRYAYLLEAGEYRFYAGKNVKELSEPVGFALNETTVLKQVGSALAPVQPFKRMVKRGNTSEPEFEAVPLSDGQEDAKRLENMPHELICTGDTGIKLTDVAKGKNTLEEFAAQLSDRDLACIIRGEGMGSPKVTAGTASAFGGVSKHLQELGVPCVCCSDGPSGMRLDCGTKAFSLPSGTCLACTWDRELLTRLFAYTGLEMSANKVECLLGPGMNIHRYPLNGRNFEYFSEDPFVTGEIAVAQLKGLHESQVTGTIKHFCGNNQETRRHFLDSIISERALREIYLKGFKTAVERGGAYTIMTTYGQVNGLYTAGSYDLTTTILRNEWGFEGVAMTDWWANINRRGAAPDKSDLAAMAAAQNDLYMVCADGGEHEDNTLEALADGRLKRAELQRCAINILKVVLRTNAMKRLTGSADTVTVTGREEDETAAQEEVKCYHVTDCVTVDLSDVRTARDTSYSFILDFEKFGRYEYELTVSSDAGELAQIPVTVFSMGTASGTFTFNGTGGRPVSVQGSAYMFSRYTTMRLYFAQGGLKLHRISFKLTDT